MGMVFTFYLGPSADWLLPRAGYKTARERAQATVERFRLGNRACLDFDPNSCFHVVKVGDARLIREVWTAYFPPGSTGPAAPPRQFHWHCPPAKDEAGLVECSGFDIEQEKRWFRETFADQLRELAEAFGGEPTIKWGVVTKVS